MQIFIETGQTSTVEVSENAKSRIIFLFTVWLPYEKSGVYATQKLPDSFVCELLSLTKSAARARKQNLSCDAVIHNIYHH